jgi:hypothetical protein
MRHHDMPKQPDGYNMKTEFIKHMMSLSIKTQPSVNICASFQISPQKLQTQGVVFILFVAKEMLIISMGWCFHTRESDYQLRGKRF